MMLLRLTRCNLAISSNSIHQLPILSFQTTLMIFTCRALIGQQNVLFVSPQAELIEWRRYLSTFSEKHRKNTKEIHKQRYFNSVLRQ